MLLSYLLQLKSWLGEPVDYVMLFVTHLLLLLLFLLTFSMTVHMLSILLTPPLTQLRETTLMVSVDNLSRLNCYGEFCVPRFSAHGGTYRISSARSIAILPVCSADTMQEHQLLPPFMGVVHVPCWHC